MHKYLTNSLQDDEKLADQHLLTLKQHLFSFNINQNTSMNNTTTANTSTFSNYTNKYRNGTTTGHRYRRSRQNYLQKDQTDNNKSGTQYYEFEGLEGAGSEHRQNIKLTKKRQQEQKNHKEQTQNQDMENDQVQHENIWRPKLPHKKIFEDPKFLLSMERKKLRVINGLKNSDLMIAQIQKIQPKGYKLKSKKQMTHRPKIFSQPKQVSQNYTHTSLNLRTPETHRKTKAPYINFNLHHLIKQRKRMSCKNQQYNGFEQGKKGSNLPYYRLFKSERFDINHKSTLDHKDMKQADEKLKPRAQEVQTANINKNHQIHKISTAHQRRSFNQSINL